MSDDYAPTTEEVCRTAAFGSLAVHFMPDAATNEAWPSAAVRVEAKAVFHRWLAEHDRQVAAESAKAEQSKFIEWLIDIAYPFDFRFDSKPPVDGDALARRWNERDGWGVSHEEAAAMIFEESGILTAWEKHKAAPDE